MKEVFVIAVAAVLVAGCAKNKVVLTQGPGDAVSFGVYVPKVVTKAGATGTITTNGADGTVSLQTEGFGVFASYSDGSDYASTIGPNFMYNQKVYFSEGAWTYTPTKYWPNETIDDGHGASGPAAADKLSFFAYGPWVTAGSGATGITALTGNDVTTDPKVTYAVASNPSEAVDLIWAVAPAGGFSYTDVHNATVSVTEGMPLINLTKPKTDTKISFRFRHATARLDFKIVGAFDQVTAGGTLDPATKVTVEQIRVVNLPVKVSGKLNLNNTVPNTPLWESLAGDSPTLEVFGDNLNPTIKDSGIAEVQTVEGVIPSVKNVFADNKTFFALIPTEDVSKDMQVEITYYVTTEDSKLALQYSRVQNVIRKTITFGHGFQAGNAYTIKIILGLTSVKLEASVEPWDVQAETEIHLPQNAD